MRSRVVQSVEVRSRVTQSAENIGKYSSVCKVLHMSIVVNKGQEIVCSVGKSPRNVSSVCNGQSIGGLVRGSQGTCSVN